LLGGRFYFEAQNSKYFLAALLNEAMPFFMLEPPAKSIPFGAGLLFFASSVV
jgi:hypothetical protein